MMNLRQVMVFSVAALALAGCGEREQTAGQGGTKKSDAKVWQGAQSASYTASGWKAGDKDSWEAQMKTRAQQGQNEYTRVAATPSSAKP
jgi:outer membrane biogenesis lipoprotein LolB